MDLLDFDTLNKMDVVSVDGKPYLFTDIRVNRKTLPEGMVAYDVGDSDSDGCFHWIKSCIRVGYWGTIIGPERIEAAEGKSGYDCCECDGNFFEKGVTLEEYTENYDALREQSRGDKAEYEKKLSELKALPAEDLLQRFFILRNLDENEEVTTSSVYDFVENTAEGVCVRNLYYSHKTQKDLYLMYVDSVGKFYNYLDRERNDELEDGETREEYIEAIKEAEEDLREYMTATEKGEQK